MLEKREEWREVLYSSLFYMMYLQNLSWRREVRRALVLTSGGLDSLLALKLMALEGLEVTAVHFVSWFNIPRFKMLEDFRAEDQVGGFQLRNIDVSKDYTKILLNPVHGYGSGINPCIDCRIFFFRRAKELMEQLKADFVATGEVVGQRPMTQNRDIMRHIEKESGLEGYLLRPLSAHILNPTIPEKEGWVNRDHFFGISGRGRKPQMALARELGIEEYPSPAGGCILTEKGFAARFRDLITHKNALEPNDLFILRYGRHFRLSSENKLVVGRNREENEFLQKLQWGNLKIDLPEIPGPFSLMEWDGSLRYMRSAMSIIARYSDLESSDMEVRFDISFKGRRRTISHGGVADQRQIDEMIIR
jgi:tRNA-specific 2-thiouridylase